MQRWEYLVAWIDSSQRGESHWSDSTGRRGSVPIGDHWHAAGAMLAQLGAEGWELVGIEQARFFLKRPKQ